MQPTAVTWALLGLLGQRPRSGYDIKRTVDRTIRHFWAASYGQIYPELKRLEEAGWIDGRGRADRAGARGACTRSRRRGAPALEGWLHGHETRIELRDESLLRLFFADALPAEPGFGLLRARREGYAAMLAYLRSLDDGSGRARSALRRSRLPLGPRLLRMGNRMVRSAGAPLAPGRLNELPEPTWRLLVGRGLPQFAVEGFVPVLVFYGVWQRRARSGGRRVDRRSRWRSPAGRCATAGKAVCAIAIGAVFVVIQAIVGLASHSATVYLAQPVVFGALWADRLRLGRRSCRPAVDRRLRERLVPVPAVVSARARRTGASSGLQSLVWGARTASLAPRFRLCTCSCTAASAGSWSSRS